MTLDDLPDILTVREAADYLRIGLNSAYALTRQWRLSGGREGPSLGLDRLISSPPEEDFGAPSTSSRTRHKEPDQPQQGAALRAARC
ncbi:MAG: hypothetical protein ACR2KK_02850 [Acidimicrobiales bacterium]